MKIGIDISQTVYKNTGVANIVFNLINYLSKIDEKNEYILFFSSFRRNVSHEFLRIEKTNRNVKIKTFRIPPSLLDFFWNRLHIFPIERLIGDVDIFITSDWTEPPAKKAKKATILYDLTIYKCPDETDKKIVETQKRKLKWVKEESSCIICISEATKRDAVEVLGLEEEKLKVVYPGVL